MSDEVAGVEVLKLDYTIPQGAAAGLYAKAFPGGLDANRAELVRLAVKADDSDQARQVTVAVEIKGAAGVQRIPLQIYPDWTPIEVLVDWPAVGALKEVVVSVNSAADSAPATSSIEIDGRFEKLSVIRKLSMSPLARLGGVLLASLVVSVLVAILRKATSGQPAREPTGAVETFPAAVSAPESSWVRAAQWRPRPGGRSRAHRTLGDRDRARSATRGDWKPAGWHWAWPWRVQPSRSGGNLG